MVGHEDVGAPRVRMDFVHDPERPEGVEASGEDGGFPEEAAEAVAVGIGAKRGQPVGEDERRPEDDDGDVARPDQERQRDGQGFEPEHAGIIG